MNSRSRAALVLRLALNNGNQYEIINTPPPPRHLTCVAPVISEHEHESDGPGYIECLEADLTPDETKELVDNEARSTALEPAFLGYLHDEKQNPEIGLLEDIIIFTEADSVDTTPPRQPTVVDTPPLVDQIDATELVPSGHPTAEAKTRLSRYSIDETEPVPSGNLTAETESNLLTDKTELVPCGNLTAETETNLLNNETEFVLQNMPVEVHTDAADDCLSLDYDSYDSVKDPNYVPDTVRSPPSLHNSPAKLTKKRKINPANRKIAKRRRNEGLEYTSFN